jgi:hypothetical protein
MVEAQIVDVSAPIRCNICADPVTAKVSDALIAAGEPNVGIVATLKTLGATRIGVSTVQRHRDVCRAGSLAKARFAAGQKKPGDFATLVRDEANRLMEAGELSVTTQHGLQAQQIIDNRESKQQDRALMVSIARMLTGGGIPDALIVGGVAYEEIESGLDPDDLEMVGA